MWCLTSIGMVFSRAYGVDQDHTGNSFILEWNETSPSVCMLRVKFPKSFIISKRVGAQSGYYIGYMIRAWIKWRFWCYRRIKRLLVIIKGCLKCRICWELTLKSCCFPQTHYSPSNEDFMGAQNEILLEITPCASIFLEASRFHKQHTAKLELVGLLQCLLSFSAGCTVHVAHINPINWPKIAIKKLWLLCLLCANWSINEQSKMLIYTSVLVWLRLIVFAGYWGFVLPEGLYE